MEALSRERAFRRRKNAARFGRGACLLAFGLCVLTGSVSWGKPWPCYTVPTEFKGGYKLQESDLLGDGAFGKVYKCQDATGNLHAVKVIPMWRMQLDTNREDYRAKLEQEIEVHQHIGPHPNVVQLIESIDIEGDVAGWPRWKMIVLELAKGGELKDLIAQQGKIPEMTAKHIFAQIVSAMQHLHARNVIHRDLKTDNILLTDASTDMSKPAVKLIDFGAGYWARDGNMEATQCIGTLETMAPEVILARGDDFDLSDPSQITSTTQIEFRVRPFGIRKYAPGPGGKGARVVEIIEQERYNGDPLGQAWKKGVRNGWVVKSVGGVDVTQMNFDDILDLMGDRLLDNSSRGAFDGSFKVTGDNKGKGKILPKVTMAELPLTVEYVEIKGKPYGPKADVWSLGVVLYQMLTGQSPFKPDETAILAGTYTPAGAVSPEVSDLMNKMLVVDPAQRFSLSQVASHPWLR